jgi:hypothetical protein
MHIKGINRGKKWFKNYPNLSISSKKEPKKSKFAQEITTVDDGGHSRLYPSIKEILVIF